MSVYLIVSEFPWPKANPTPFQKMKLQMNVSLCLLLYIAMYCKFSRSKIHYENVVCIDRRERLEEEKPEKARLNSKSFSQGFFLNLTSD